MGNLPVNDTISQSLVAGELAPDLGTSSENVNSRILRLAAVGTALTAAYFGVGGLIAGDRVQADEYCGPGGHLVGRDSQGGPVCALDTPITHNTQPPVTSPSGGTTKPTTPAGGTSRPKTGGGTVANTQATIPAPSFEDVIRSAYFNCAPGLGNADVAAQLDALKGADGSKRLSEIVGECALTFSGGVDPAISRPKSNLDGMIATTNLNITPNPAQSDAFSAFEVAAWNALNALAVTEAATTTAEPPATTAEAAATTATPTTAEATITVISAPTTLKPIVVKVTVAPITTEAKPAVAVDQNQTGGNSKNTPENNLPLGMGLGIGVLVAAGVAAEQKVKKNSLSHRLYRKFKNNGPKSPYTPNKPGATPAGGLSARSKTELN